MKHNIDKKILKNDKKKVKKIVNTEKPKPKQEATAAVGDSVQRCFCMFFCTSDDVSVWRSEGHRESVLECVRGSVVQWAGVDL